ncbi:hypothetical protein ABKA04_009607 [Annulohypoxylon sp. FPYF3050]
MSEPLSMPANMFPITPSAYFVNDDMNNQVDYRTVGTSQDNAGLDMDALGIFDNGHGTEVYQYGDNISLNFERCSTPESQYPLDWGESL